MKTEPGIVSMLMCKCKLRDERNCLRSTSEKLSWLVTLTLRQLLRNWMATRAPISPTSAGLAISLE